MTILNWLHTLRVRMQARKAARSTIKELSALTNHELNDIGIARGEIRHLANQYAEDILRENLKSLPSPAWPGLEVNPNLKGSV